MDGTFPLRRGSAIPSVRKAGAGRKTELSLSAAHRPVAPWSGNAHGEHSLAAQAAQRRLKALKQAGTAPGRFRKTKSEKARLMAPRDLGGKVAIIPARLAS